MVSNKYTVNIFGPMYQKLQSFLKQKENKSSRFSTLLSYQTVGQAALTNENFENQVLSGYQKNSIVYRCITLITRSLSTIPLMLYENGLHISRHPILNLLHKPNPLQNYTSFCETALAYLLLSGNSFIEAVAPTDEEAPLELYSLRPDRLNIIPGKKGFPIGYEYRLNNQTQRVPIDPITGFSPILHSKLFNPLDGYKGMSPLMACQYSIDLQNTITNHNLALLQNAGCPSGALIVRGTHLTEAQRAELKEDLAKIKGTGSGRLLLLDGDFDWKEMGLSPKDMNFSDGKNMASRDIAQVFGVPPMCVGILGDSTYSNYQEARLHLWEDTLLPILDFFVDHLNRWLIPFFKGNFFLSYNKDDIHALIPRREKLWDRVSRISCLTINEKRKILGYEPLPGGDILAQSSEREAMIQEGAIR
jgi:HK97 family phage portal protein